MRIGCIGKMLTSFGLITVAAVSLATAAPPDRQPRGMAPQIVVGPEAEPANVAGAALPSQLFNCQVGETPFVCYDPFQMRTA
jgi:hypothetical protein